MDDVIRKNNAIVISAVNQIEIRELDLPKIGSNDVLYQVKSCSLCTVEQRVYSGAKNFGYPLLGGHENAGTVIAIGEDVKEFKIGDNVVATYGYCGQCEFCKIGQGTKCTNAMKSKPRVKFEGPIIGGGLAKYLAVPAWQLCKIPNNANFDHFSLTEPLACCVHSINKAKIEFGDTVVIIGAGVMGLFHAILAKMKGAYVIISETDNSRCEKALTLGIDRVINPSEVSLIDTIMEITNKKGADVVINAISSPKIWPDALAILAPYGRLIAYSSQDSNEPIGINMDKLHNKEYQIIGTVSPTMASNLQATKLISRGLINIESFIDSRFTSDQAKPAFDRASATHTYRVIINHL